ncbi:MAG: glycosyltransferase [Sphaerochaetaceae bacterium]|nr:glycosyltransferase [Sphaerochaetaceae bacterium]MDD4008157.1 glycosyltransferase [Sphaerochaetaceae bacterium]
MIVGEYVDCYPPDVDGVGMVVKSYVENLNSMGNTAYYVAPRGKKPYPGNFPLLQFPSIPMIGKEPYTVGIPYVGMQYNYDIKRAGFELIHVHSPFSAGMEATEKAWKADIPLVTSFHSKYYDDFLLKTGSKFIASSIVKLIVRFYEKCDEVWTVNNATADVLRGYGYNGGIVIMPNGTNLWYPTPEDRKAAQDLYHLGDGTVFLFVGQHSFKKNIKLIIESLAVYSKTHSDFKMLFVGQGPDENEMHQMIDEAGLHDKVVFAGHISDRNLMKQIYSRADLFLFPSLYDNAPMVVREAAAAGTPSILMRGSCSAEGVTDDVNGFLCENDPVEMASRIEAALPLADKVGEEARRTIPLAWTEVMKMVVERYQNLIDRFEKEGSRR